MLHLLDTNVLIHVRDGHPGVRNRLTALRERLAMSIVSRVELEGGVVRFPARSAARRTQLDVMLAGLPALAFDDASADAYRRIVEAAGYSRRKILDRMIAAQAIAHHAVLVTLNPDDVSDIPGLKVLAW